MLGIAEVYLPSQFAGPPKGITSGGKDLCSGLEILRRLAEARPPVKRLLRVREPTPLNVALIAAAG
jgi:hypothetical protein